MNTPPWIEQLTARDRQAVELLGYGARQGYGKRPALLVIDVNYEFCGHDDVPLLEVIKQWPTACGEDAWRAVAVMRRLIDAVKSKGLPVFYSTNTRRPDGFDAGSWKWKSAGTRGKRARIERADDIVEPIAPRPEDVIIRKTKPSVFFGTPFVSFLVDLKVDSLIVCGGTTSGCVRASVVDAFSHNLRCAVVEDACFDRLQCSHAVSLLDLQAKYADVVDCAEAVRFIASLEPGMFELPGMQNGLAD
jgi:nicotinamidase-related amidase